MKSRHLFLLLLFIPMLLSAKTLTKSELTTLGTRAFHLKAQRICPSATAYSLKGCDYLRDDGAISLAVLHFDNGFLILSAEDAVMPVLAYGFEGDLDMGNLAPGVETFLSQYRQEIVAARHAQLPPNEEIANAWKELRQPSRAVTEEVVVSPLITARWNQSKFYNYYSPQDENAPGGYDGKVPNGCVAVAMGQIIYYYRYPESGSGSHTNYTYDYGSFYVNFAQQHYNYDAMEDQLSYYNNEVAKLIFHCATSVDMGYGPDGSGAYSHNVPDAMSTYFKYNNDSHFRNKSNYSNTEWHQMLKADLDAARPIYYSGYSQEGGHAFVCDGYNSDNYFHFNFGWGGSGNGYYLTQGNDNSTVNGYGYGQSAIFNLHPRSENYPSYCSDRVITAQNGSLEDGSGNYDYLNNMNCTYIITHADQYEVNVTLQHFNTQAGHDYLRFWNGHPSHDSLLAEFSGSISDGTYNFSTDSLYITFETDDSVTAQGWHLSFRSHREGIACGTVVTHDHSGEITDGSGNDDYRDNLNCNWMIRLSDVPSITFTFSEMDISPEDHLEFYNLNTYPNELLGSFTGNDLPAPITYYLNKIKVTFVSDNYLSRSGFRLTWASANVGVEEFGAKVSVYPNPVSDMLHVELDEPLGQGTVTVYDMVGHAVFSQTFSGVGHMDIPVGGLSEGVYMLRLDGDGRVMHQKIMVRH